MTKNRLQFHLRDSPPIPWTHENFQEPAGQICRFPRQLALVLRLCPTTALLDALVSLAPVCAFALYGRAFIPFGVRAAWLFRYGKWEQPPITLGAKFDRRTLGRLTFFGLVTVPKYAELMSCGGTGMKWLKVWATCYLLAFLIVEGQRFVPYKTKEELQAITKDIGTKGDLEKGHHPFATQTKQSKEHQQPVVSPGQDKETTPQKSAIDTEPPSDTSKINPTSNPPNSKQPPPSTTKPSSSFPPKHHCNHLRCHLHDLLMISLPHNAPYIILPLHLLFLLRLFTATIKPLILTPLLPLLRPLTHSSYLFFLDFLAYCLVLIGYIFTLHLVLILLYKSLPVSRTHLEPLRLHLLERYPIPSKILAWMGTMGLSFLIVFFWEPAPKVEPIERLALWLADWPLQLPVLGILVAGIALPVRGLLGVEWVRKRVVDEVVKGDREVHGTVKGERGWLWIVMGLWTQAGCLVVLVAAWFRWRYETGQTVKPGWTEVWGFGGKTVTPMAVVRDVGM
ncbi:MAG: hypothetical protein M1820_005238 [Bogoriella megaspora]|nr:MAG: hypothetical protein M1820_005238 [Bogoriella megaspora]